MNEIERKQEASISVQGRVSIVELAELGKYWESNGYDIRTISQLIGWSIDLLYEVLKGNGKVSEVKGTVAEAYNYLVSKGLWQRSMEKRNKAKVATAIRFEGIREEGYEPEIVDPRSFGILHNNRSVTVSGETLLGKKAVEAVEIYNRLCNEKQQGVDEEAIVIKSKMTDEELDRKAKEIKKKDEEERLRLDEFFK